jgi:hypothetical protein
MMNEKQKAAKEVLQNELRKRRGITKPLPERDESREGYSFTEVERVTVCIGLRGGYILPAVRSYRGKALDAAVFADDEFKKNMEGPHESGHDGKIVETDWQCDSSRCNCKHENYKQRFERSARKGGR